MLNLRIARQDYDIYARVRVTHALNIQHLFLFLSAYIHNHYLLYVSLLQCGVSFYEFIGIKHYLY